MSGSSPEDSHHHQLESNCKSTAIARCRHSPRLLSASTTNSTKRTPQLNNTDEKMMKKKKVSTTKKVSFFLGDPIPQHDACTRWPHRYHDINNNNALQNGDSSKKLTAQDDDDDEKLVLNVKCHYSEAEILRNVFQLGDCAYVKGPKGGSNYVGKILEFFETIDGGEYFRVQWFFRAEDTVIKDIGKCHDKKRLFYSTLMNDNLLDCIVSKVTVVQLATTVNLKAECLPPCDFYFDMKYCVDYSTFSSIITDNQCTHFPHSNPLIMPTSNQVGNCKICTECNVDETIRKENFTHELPLLDLYSGCGGMSTGLCMGAEACGVDLVTKWAIDIDKAACESLRLNHPQTQIRNEPAENFLNLLMEWDQMCKRYEKYEEEELELGATEEADEDKQSKTDEKDSCEYEVEKLVAICHGDPDETSKRGIKFQVRWVGYGPADDTWEPIESLSNCEERIREFVLEGMKTKILPRPMDKTKRSQMQNLHILCPTEEFRV